VKLIATSKTQITVFLIQCPVKFCTEANKVVIVFLSYVTDNTLCPKNVPPLACCDFDVRQLILRIFVKVNSNPKVERFLTHSVEYILQWL